MRVAAIDCGTNSIRLLIAELTEEGLTDIVRLMKVVRLGEGVDETGELSAAALERTFAATREYAELIAEHGAERVRFVATSATRDARNRAHFANGIQKILGVEPEVISGQEEAALSFTGALSALRPGAAEPVLVVDLGGGSTEFVLGGATKGVEQSQSLDMGCVRFTERFLFSDPPTDQEIEKARGAIDLLLSDVDVDLDSVRTIVGVAGTITTVAAHSLNLEAYLPEAINGAELPIDTVQESCKQLLHSSRAARAALPFMHPGRVDVIGAGALIWCQILQAVVNATDGNVTTVTTSEHDILDGIALSIAGNDATATETTR